MVELYINNQKAVLPDEFSIRIVRKNPLFNDEGEYSIPFSIPLSENNAMLNYPNRIDVESYTKEKPFKLLVNGIIRLEGTAVLQDPKPDQDEISLYLKGSNSDFFSAIKNKSLQEYDLGGEDNSDLFVSDIENKWEDTLDSTYPSYPYVCAPVHAPNLWTHNDWIIFYKHKHHLNRYDHQDEKMERFGQNWAQHMYIMYVIKKIIQNEGYYIGRNDLDYYPDLKNHLVIITMNIQKVDYDTVEYRKNMPRKSLLEFFKCLQTLYALIPISDKKTGRVNLIMLSEVIENAIISYELNEKEVNYLLMKSEEPTHGYIMSFENISGNDFDYAKNPVSQNDATEISSYYDLPSASSSNNGKLYYITTTERFQRCFEDPNNQETYYWKEVGQLQNITSSNEEYEKKSDVEMILSDRYEKTVWRADPNNSVTFQIEKAKTQRKGNDWDYIENRNVKYQDFPFIFAFYRKPQFLDINDPYTIVEKSDHNKTLNDFNSIWQDDNGNNWELTDIPSNSEIQFIKDGHYQSMPDSGTLTHISGATNTSDINYNNTIKKDGTVFYPILSNDVYRYDDETKFTDYLAVNDNSYPSLTANKWITSQGLYKKIYNIIMHWETERKRKVIKYLSLPLVTFFNIDMTKKYNIGDIPYLINKIETDITEKDTDEKIIKAELFTV